MTNTPQRNWRFRIGIGLFVVGLFSPLFAPLVTVLNISTEWKAMLSGLLFLGIPEFLWLVAAMVMGKSGFDYIKSKTFGLIQKYVLPESVGPIRYYIGLMMFTVPLLFGWLAPYAQMLMTDISIQTFAWHISGDLLLLVSLFVLGGEFWEKLRGLYVYNVNME